MSLNLIKVGIFFVLILVLVSQPTIIFRSVSADTGGGPSLINPLCPAGDSSCTRSNVEGLLNSIIDWLLRIATPIAVGMILVGAFQIMFAGGDEEKFKRGKSTILYTAIGYAIILIGRGITLIIQDFLSR